MGFTLQYIDVTTGMIQRQPKKVMTRYLKSWFWFDLLTCMPFEYFLRLTDVTNRYSGFGLLNRAFRYYYIMHYYNICSYKLNISKHLRWTHLIYRTFFVTQLMVNIWILCACFHHNCIYVDVDGQKQMTNNTLDSILVAYAYIINICTSTGLNYVQPMTLTEMCVAAVLVLSVQYVIAALASGFATLIIIENSTLTDYKYSIERLNMYLEGHYLSEAIRSNVWAYLLQLWKIQRGEWMPMLIQEAPSYLRQDIMKSLYMSHLENHFLFSKIHTDFLRQLVVHMERCIYFPGNYIVAQGDMDSTMYFIHKGEVGAYDTNSYNKEIQLHTLRTNMSFGEAQGLHQTPYLLSYKALTTVEVLALRQSTWEYLLKWFPATSEEISKRSAEYGLISDIQTEDTTAF
ncbi:cNMP binding protein [Oryctes borbonicus]|uniref:cNMP binding protein n=1 Tax=Oryctes borbonicus TaxID=1629725 RepID=A0A0T6AXM0_9SCAR|nr:cNMP binding protein [Oryctes borbonicus]